MMEWNEKRKKNDESARAGYEVGVGGRSTFIPNVCILVYATSPWKLLPPSPLSSTRVHIFVHSRDNFNSIFASSFSFLSFSRMLYLNAENYILSDSSQCETQQFL